MSQKVPTKEELLEKRKQLQERIAKIRKDYSGGLDRDSSEQAIELENAEVLEGLLKSAMEELKRVDHQLESLS